MSQASDMAAVPRVGMLAVLRNRRGLISSVDPYDGPEGREYLVEIEYTDYRGRARGYRPVEPGTRS